MLIIARSKAQRNPTTSEINGKASKDFQGIWLRPHLSRKKPLFYQ